MAEADATDTNCADGKIYTVALTLAEGKYKYNISAMDVWGAEGSSPEVAAPVVGNPENMRDRQTKVYGGKNGYVNPSMGERAGFTLMPTESGTVNIDVYTLRGELVWHYETQCTAYTFAEASCDCRNTAGVTVASGIYLVHFKGAGIDMKKKIAVLK